MLAKARAAGEPFFKASATHAHALHKLAENVLWVAAAKATSAAKAATTTKASGIARGSKLIVLLPLFCVAQCLCSHALFRGRGCG